MKTPIVVLTLVLAGFAAGIIVGRHFFSQRQITEEPARVSRSFLTKGDAASSLGNSSRSSEPNQSGPQHRGDGKVPKQSVPDLLALTNNDDRHQALDAYAAYEMAGLLADLQGFVKTDPRARALKQVLYHHWADQAPAKALAAALSENDTRLKNEVVHHAFAGLAKRNLAEATAAFMSLETRREREEALGAMAGHANLDDMGTLAEFVRSQSSNTPSEALYRRWAERDPGAALLQSMALAQGNDAVRAVAEGWALSDPSAALEWARDVDAERVGAHATAGVLGSLTHVNPVEAAARIAEMPTGPQQIDMVREITRRWARDDFDAARAWTETLAGRSQREAIRELTHEWARLDPQAAANYALTLPDSRERRDVLSEVAHRWAREDVNQALEWASRLNEESIPAMRGILTTVADSNPQAAAELVNEWVTGGDAFAGQSDAYGELAGDLAGHWSEFDPGAAAAWAESLPVEGEVRRRTVERVADHWVEQDSLAASEWIGGLPEGEVRDVAAERLVDHVARSDPDAAYHWALSVSDPGKQTDMLDHVFEQWRKRDPQEAQAALNAAPISDKQRQELSHLFQDSR